MVSNLPPLVADGGELRLARRVASLVYGRREVTWPEDVADPEDDLPDGREFGWVAKLDGPEPGLSERRFVRADVSIDAVEKVSDVEQVLDDAALRAGGDVYFESLIEGKGLGLLKPGIDFDEGDLVDVRFWGRILKDQLVTSIDWDGDEPSVKLGGQSIRDTDSLARARAESLRLIRRERAERKDDVGRVDRKATAAQNTADTAESKADTADGKAEQAKGGAVEVDESTSEALQAETENILAQIRAQQDELAKALSGAVNVIMATAAGTSFPGVNTRPSSEGYDWEFTIPDTRGALAKIEFWDMSTIPAAHISTQIGVVDSAGQRIRTTNGMFVQVTWAKPTAIQRTINQLITDSFVPQQASWTTVQNLVASPNNNASQGYLTTRVVWNSANRGSTYGVRFLIDGEEKGRFLSSKIGPLSFVGDGERGQKTSLTNLQVPAGKNIIVQVYSTADSSSARRVKSVELTGTWIETAD